MGGLMMDRPLLISSLLEHAAEVFSSVEIVTRTVEGPIHRYTWRDTRKRSAQLAQALQGMKLRDGDTVATLAWNTYRHLELYYGVSGMGAVVHTINPRLHPTQLVYVLNHAQDRALFVDLTFVPLVEAIWDQLESVRHLVIMTDRAHMPTCKAPGVLCYEDLVAAENGNYDWPTKQSVLEFLEDQVAKLWLPDDVVFVDALPIGPTGKVQRTILRARYQAQ
jgi:fatty-acyl-CoA synthase